MSTTNNWNGWKSAITGVLPPQNAGANKSSKIKLNCALCGEEFSDDAASNRIMNYITGNDIKCFQCDECIALLNKNNPSKK